MNVKNDTDKLVAHVDRNRPLFPHLLSIHHRDTGVKAAEFGALYSPGEFVTIAACIHDIGKARPDVQRYLHNPNGVRGSVAHALPGAYLISLERNRVPSSHQILMYLLENIVAGHHRGLYDLNRSFFKRYDRHSKDEYPSLAKQWVREQAERLATIPAQLQWNDPIYCAALTRFTLSAVVDADWLDTERYFHKEQSSLRLYEAPSWKSFQEKFLHKMKALPENNLSFYRKQAEKRGTVDGSYFELILPTGFGKTYASMAFALEHAKTFKKSRIIVALPLINLTSELSAIYRDTFGVEHVVEDHSAFDPLTSEVEDLEGQSLRLAIENWDRPFIVTTTVQLFESLFSNKPSKLRKVHRLAGSVIILDEYHLLPPHLLAPILQMLDTLQEYFQVTILLVSATPYPLRNSRPIQELELKHLPQLLTNVVETPNRVQFHSIGVIDELKLLNLLADKSTLIIVNTRKRAQQLFHFFKAEYPSRPVYHLSTSLTSKDRAGRLDTIRTELSNDPLVIATPLLEAGVDISFDYVFREIAPLPSILQAAGRCNRYGDGPLGHVYIYEWPDPVYPSASYENGVEQVNNILKRSGTNGFYSKETLAAIYLKTLSQYVTSSPISEKDALQFETVATNFQMIEPQGPTVICPQVPGFDDNLLLEPKTRAWWRKIQPYTVRVFMAD